MALTLALLAGCAAPGQVVPPMASGQVAVEGRVLGVDTAPWAYDGNALVRLDSDSLGPVTVHIPARTNLCRAQGLELVGQLKPGDRLRAAGEATGPGAITVCEAPTHRLERTQ